VPLDPALETRLRALGPSEAAEQLLRGYGGEVYSFLVSTLRDTGDADEAFSMFCEDVWRGLPNFRGASSYRSWTYQIARHAAYRLKRGDGRRNKRTTLDDGDAAERLAVEIRTTTAAFLKTDVKDKFRALRDVLKPEDQELLLLRLDRELEWNEIAEILEEDAATLRKRFERLKDKLRVLAEKAGLLKTS
jgi:RNA polymerase sigma-70 factor, ECF subfamily